MAALTGCGGAVTEAHPSTSEPTREGAAASAPAASPEPVAQAEAAEHPEQVPQRPDHLRMGDIDAPVVPLVLSGTTLTPPADPTVLGWWGRRAGADHGVTLLVGHTVHTGGGDLDHLADVPLGTVAAVDGHRYRVTSNEIMSKAALARRAPRLLAPSGPHRLVVVTCADYDPATGHYRSNVVLTATPLGRAGSDAHAGQALA